jgi:hypothetical protein
MSAKIDDDKLLELLRRDYLRDDAERDKFLRWKAADALEAARREIAELRVALRPFAEAERGWQRYLARLSEEERHYRPGPAYFAARMREEDFTRAAELVPEGSGPVAIWDGKPKRTSIDND